MIVSGFPAAGKSTLSRRLARDLGFVVVSRDRIVVDSGLRGVQSFLPAERSPMIPAATDRLVDLMADAVLDGGHGVVIDNNFNWPEQRAHVRRLLDRRTCPRVEVCLWGEPAVLKRRFAARADPPMDDHLSEVFDVAVARPRKPVLRPPDPIFEFDTTDLNDLDFNYRSLLSAVEASLDSPREPPRESMPTVPGTGDEKLLLSSTLAFLRESVLRKVSGIDDTQARWRPDGKLISLVGIVNHLAHVEWRWIDGTFLGEEVSRDETEFIADGVSIEHAMDAYRRRGRKTDAIIAAASSLDELARRERVGVRDLRWIVTHLIQETARHAGHADATREMLDGAVGE